MFNQIDGISSHHLGARTMKRVCNLNDDTLTLVDRRQFRENDIVLYSFGEIDVRFHIQNQIRPNVDALQLIDTLTTQYIERLSIHGMTFVKHVRLGVVGIVPPGRIDDINKRWKSKWGSVAGSDEERLSYVRSMNDCLRRLCAQRDMIFLDVYDVTHDVDGMMDQRLTVDHVHITDSEPIKQLLITNRLI